MPDKKTKTYLEVVLEILQTTSPLSKEDLLKACIKRQKPKGKRPEASYWGNILLLRKIGKVKIETHVTVTLVE